MIMPFVPPSDDKIRAAFPELAAIQKFADGGFKVVYRAALSGKDEAFKLVCLPDSGQTDQEKAAYRKEAMGRIRREVELLGKCRRRELVKLGALTPKSALIDGTECVYAIFENGVARCGIEKAYYENAISFRKPVSCHLYPVRISKLGENIALNYHHWHICEPARELGKAKGMPVFRFLREAIVRVWGVSFYEELEIVYKEMGNP